MAKEYDESVEEFWTPAHRGLVSRLKRAMTLSNIGVSRTWPLDKRAAFCLRAIGVGGRVSLDNPSTVKSAIIALENYRR